MPSRFGLVALLAVVGACQVFAHPLDELQPGEWYEVPDSGLRTVFPDAGSIVSPWSGGAYDTLRDRLIVWGGGHGDSCDSYDNRIYIFDIEAMTWTRLTELPADGDADGRPDFIRNAAIERCGYYPTADITVAPEHLHPDGHILEQYCPDYAQWLDLQQPRARHTYNYIQYVPLLDSFCSFGGAAFYYSGQSGTRIVDCYNFATGMWEQWDSAPDRSTGRRTTGIGAFSAVDPTTGIVWAHGAGSSYSTLGSFDPRAAPGSQWQTHFRTGWEPGGLTYRLTAAIDPINRRMIAIGGGNLYLWDIDNPDDPVLTPTATGAVDILSAVNPGVDYDPVAQRVVAWSGPRLKNGELTRIDDATVVYSVSLDPAATDYLVWSRHAATSLGKLQDPIDIDACFVEETDGSFSHAGPRTGVCGLVSVSNGTFGRFRYMPSYHAFVIYNGANIYFYRLSAADDLAPASPTALWVE